jgi:hypothetical protein
MMRISYSDTGMDKPEPKIEYRPGVVVQKLSSFSRRVLQENF